MWTKYSVRWEFFTALCAGLPADPEMLRQFLESRKPRVRPPEARSIDEIAAEVSETVLMGEETEQTEETLHVFQRVNGGLAMRCATVRAHIKDVVSTLSSLYVGKVQGERSFAVRAKAALYYPPEVYWLPVVRPDGSPITEPTGIRRKPIHMNTPRGPRSAIKVYEYIEEAVLEFPLWVLTQPNGKLVVSEADLKTIFMYGGVHGYGPERGDGEGRYAFTLTARQEE